MKKYLLSGGFAAILLLSACGDEEPEAAEEVTEEATSEEQTEEMVNMMGGDELAMEDYDEFYGFDMSNATENLMEFATNPELDVYVDGYDAYKKLSTYTTNQADENGTITNEYNGFKETVNVLLVEDDLGETHIAVAGEQINGTDEILYSSSQHDMTTDTMEQLRASAGMNGLGGMYEPNTRHQGMSLATLDFPEDKPTEIDMQFDGVFNTHESEYGGEPAYYADDYFLEYDEMTFTLME